MVKAHSLLYAIYICLIVSVICGALLYFSTLYSQLNLHYNLQEEMFIHNQSIVNFALGNNLLPHEMPQEENLAMQGSYETKQFGLLKLIVAKSSIKNDTIASAYFAGKFISDNTAIYLPSFSSALSYSGKVKLIGDKKLPSAYISLRYFAKVENELISTGLNEISESLLPEINPKFKNNFAISTQKKIQFKDIERKSDSIYFNSFLNETIELQLSSSVLSNIVIKGNFILYSKDSIHIQKSAILEDVIIKAPRISFSDDFKGNVQAFSTENIEIGERAILEYPSILCVYNTDENRKGSIKVKEQAKVSGAVVLFGNNIANIDNNTICLHKETQIMGDIYCTGKFMIEGTLYGSVYTNRFFNTTAQKDNCIINALIDVTKKPNYFISIPLFENKNNAQYGIIKRVL